MRPEQGPSRTRSPAPAPPIDFPLLPSSVPSDNRTMNLYHAFVLTAMALPSTVFAAESGTEAAFLSHTRQLIYEGRRSGEGYFSPDGKSLIFQSEREPGNPFYQIYTIDLESGESRRVSPGT